MSRAIQERVRHILQCYEVDGEVMGGLNPPEIEVRSHWSSRRLVVVIVGGIEYALRRDDLEKALENCTNWSG